MLGENPNDYSTGIPAEEVFYQDLVGQPFAARDLRSLKLGSSGKPDGLIRTADGACAESDSHEAEHEGGDEPAALCFSQLEH
jgi:hypothetical protein